jgi:hypothetical protein
MENWSDGVMENLQEYWSEGALEECGRTHWIYMICFSPKLQYSKTPILQNFVTPSSCHFQTLPRTWDLVLEGELTIKYWPVGP